MHNRHKFFASLARRSLTFIKHFTEETASDITSYALSQSSTWNASQALDKVHSLTICLKAEQRSVKLKLKATPHICIYIGFHFQVSMDQISAMNTFPISCSNLNSPDFCLDLQSLHELLHITQFAVQVLKHFSTHIAIVLEVSLTWNSLPILSMDDSYKAFLKDPLWLYRACISGALVWLAI